MVDVVVELIGPAPSGRLRPKCAITPEEMRGACAVRHPVPDLSSCAPVSRSLAHGLLGTGHAGIRVQRADGSLTVIG